ncbi:hypothetical protein [Mucilaginibacter rubeus]|jgi:hypothetical protein|uniref:hypothetical protein n=1 Tax=Mucilaginibacter rubeus TaxID=2027860 RepID=UPI001667197F|nr:hypothetical protein [Mucilaginibacter rubeus]GGB02168.1 hypothetical protein GCM10011500_17490 [Mucilaginibacter rubeus]
MKYITLLLLFSSALLSCRTKKDKASAEIYPTVSYLKIKLDAAGHLPANPYILRFKNDKKEIVFCGVNHLPDNNDTENPMFKGIKKAFFEFRPDVCVNEGGDVSKKVFASKKEAIQKDGEIGLTKTLADSLKIITVNGDMTDSLEFKELLKRYTTSEFLAYIVTERFMWGQRLPVTDSAAFKANYAKFIQGYIMKTGGVKLSPAEQTLDYFEAAYQKLLNRPFKLEELEPTNPFDPKGKFQEIGRASKEIRDQSLLRTIDNLLKTHNKVFVVFGGWHLLTCEPGLKQIINKSE